MKHIVPVLFCLFFVCALCVPAFAAEATPASDPTAATAATEPFSEVSSGVEVIPDFDGVYPMAYSMLRYYLYSDYPLTSSMELTLTACATILAIFVIALPVVVVFIVIRFLVGG